MTLSALRPFFTLTLLICSLQMSAVGCGGAESARSTLSAVPRYEYQVVATYPHDTSLFTQGLAMSEQGELIVSAGGYGESALLIRSLESVAPHLSRRLSSERFAEGVAQLGSVILLLTWQAGEALLYRADDLSPLGALSYDTQGWGLAYGPHGVIYSDGSSELRWVSHPALERATQGWTLPAAPISGTLEVNRTQTIREQGRVVAQLNELEWVGRLLVANLWQRDELVVIDPEQGEVVARVDLSKLLSDELRPEGFDPLNDVLNGVAWLPASPNAHQLSDLSALTSSAGRLFVTGKRWPLIFELKLSPKPQHVEAQ